jgi:NAD-dependent SIR2 family protein deacetylase
LGKRAQTMPTPIEAAARALRQSQALLITAGAGMGVDSGLPDFRGDQGFWRAYPAFAKLGLSFSDLANPEWFEKDPALAWGFYGHRLNLYRATEPHAGFEILRNWGESKSQGCFVFTSNVDGAFQKAGFPQNRVTEVHGSIHHLQCLRKCDQPIFSAEGISVSVDSETCRASEPFPRCPTCNSLARPNILMFGDGGWDNRRSRVQSQQLNAWLKNLAPKTLAIIECGAGTAIPTVRAFSEQMQFLKKAALIRINKREPGIPDGGYELEGGAMEVLKALNESV